MTKTQEVETTEEVVNDGTLSPIEVSKLAGVRPQMVYNYIGNGYIAAERINGKLRIQEDVAHEWVAAYLERKAERLAAKAAKAEAELTGAEA